MTTEVPVEGGQPEPVNRRNFLKIAGAVAASTAVAATIAARELTRPAPATHLVAHRREGDLPLDPDDRAWSRLASWPVTMLIQNLVLPHAPDLVVPEIEVKALHNGERIGFRVEWVDAEADEVDAMARFRDAVAVQLPVDPTTTPAVTMGLAAQPVHIMQWRAAWQVDVDEGRQGVRTAFPNMYKDAAPEELMGEEKARVFYPAVYVGNPMAQRERATPVADLTAVGFGSLTTHEEQTADGRGVFKDGHWSVVITSPLAGGVNKTALTLGLRTVAAFAVWNGSHDNRGSRKQWSNWTELEIEA